MSRRIVQRPPSVPYDGLVETTYGPWVAVLAGGGFVVGLILLARGLSGYRSAARVGDTATSTISAMAAGEVRISGTIEPAELTLVSLLQSVPCVYYRAAVEHGGERRTRDSDYTEERAVGFRVRDATGEVRIFPRGAHVEAPSRFQDETTLMGPTAAWGNAGIPGFGIGRPVRAPQIDPAANALALASPAEAARAERTFAIAPETLVLAASSEVPLFIAFGSPGAVVERAQTRFVIGLLGAVLAIVSAMVFAIDLGVGFSR